MKKYWNAPEIEILFSNDADCICSSGDPDPGIDPGEDIGEWD